MTFASELILEGLKELANSSSPSSFAHVVVLLIPCLLRSRTRFISASPTPITQPRFSNFLLSPKPPPDGGLNLVTNMQGAI